MRVSAMWTITTSRPASPPSMLESSADSKPPKGAQMKLWTASLVAVLALASLDADAARRLGGGRSIGRQSPNVTQREATPPAPRRPWGAMLGGLAAGLGLAWLANSLGFGAGFANLMLVLLVGLVLMMVVGMVLRSRRPAMAGG